MGMDESQPEQKPSQSKLARWWSRHSITIYSHCFGAGLLVVFVATALAMLRHLAQVERANIPWTHFWVFSYPRWWELSAFPWHVVALIICSLPYILAFGAVNVYRWGTRRHSTELVCGKTPTRPEMKDLDWEALVQWARSVWRDESQRLSENLRIAHLHALIFGLISSLTLFICTMILARYLLQPGPAPSQLVLVTVAVGTATAFAFAIDLGRILFRLALRDAGAEIFSFATRSSILVVVSTLLFSTLLCSGLEQIQGSDQPIPLGVPGFIVIGATIAIIGSRAVRFVSERAAGALGVGAAHAPRASDLIHIEGLEEEDIGRLAEEGVDSVHALAFVPLPRLLFSTKYALDRLCDWQDQALLLTHIGQDKAKLLRDHLVVRGALSAQDAALRFFSDEAPRPADQPPGAPDGRTKQEKLANLLGFETYDQARFALMEIAKDENVHRLRVYATAVQVDVQHPHRARDAREAREARTPDVPAGAPASPQPT